MAEPTDRRIDNAKHLRGYPLRRQPWRPRSESWDHDHCAACWAKFFRGVDDLSEGYATTEAYPQGAEYDWVCPSCFDDLHEVMEWETVP